jgi:hypothetical protein
MSSDGGNPRLHLEQFVGRQSYSKLFRQGQIIDGVAEEWRELERALI